MSLFQRFKKGIPIISGSVHLIAVLGGIIMLLITGQQITNYMWGGVIEGDGEGFGLWDAWGVRVSSYYQICLTSALILFTLAIILFPIAMAFQNSDSFSQKEVNSGWLFLLAGLLIPHIFTYGYLNSVSIYSNPNPEPTITAVLTPAYQYIWGGGTWSAVHLSPTILILNIAATLLGLVTLVAFVLLINKRIKYQMFFIPIILSIAFFGGTFLMSLVSSQLYVQVPGFPLGLVMLGRKIDVQSLRELKV